MATSPTAPWEGGFVPCSAQVESAEGSARVLDGAIVCPLSPNQPRMGPLLPQGRGYGLQGTQPLGLHGPFPSAWVLTSVLLFHSFSKYSRITQYLAREAWRMAVPFTEMGRSEAGAFRGRIQSSFWLRGAVEQACGSELRVHQDTD